MPLTDGDPDSLNRFLIAAEAVRRAGRSVTPEGAFSVLARVANESSRWQIVFDPTDSRVEFRTVALEGTFEVDLSNVDFRCRERPLMAKLTAAADIPASLAPAEPAAISGVSRQVLASLPQGAGLRPQMAGALTAGLLAALRCET